MIFKIIGKFIHTQKDPLKYVQTIPYMLNVSETIQKEIKKFNTSHPTKPNEFIFQSMCLDKETINLLETGGIYKIRYHNSNEKDKIYIEVAKRKI